MHCEIKCELIFKSTSCVCLNWFKLSNWTQVLGYWLNIMTTDWIMPLYSKTFEVCNKSVTLPSTFPICFTKVISIFLWSFRLLNEAQGSLLDDEQLVNTLQTSKKTSEEVTEQLQVSEQTELKIDAAREVSSNRFYVMFIVLFYVCVYLKLVMWNVSQVFEC